MAAKLTMMEEDWTRQPSLPVRLFDRFIQRGGFFTFAGANTIDRAGSTSITAGPSGLATATDGGSVNYFALKKFPFAQIGQIWLAVFSTQATAGPHAIVGEVDNSTSYIEDFFINCAADTYVAGSCEATIRDTAGNMLRAYTGNIGLNDGKVRTAVFFLESPTAFRCFVDGAEKPLTYANAGTLSGLSGTMEYDQWMHTRNIRGAGQYGSSTSQRIYLYARLIGNVETARLLSKNPWQIFEPEEIPLFKPVVTAQYARPTSDVSAGTWTASTGSDLFAMLDEAAADDGDYITSTTASTCEVALGSLSDPALSTGHIVRYRISATGGGIIVRLREGSTTIASWTHNPAPASPTTYAQTLSGGEADSITNYAALKLQFEAIA